MDQKVIILIGAPGSGKGTQGELLADKLGFYYSETSKFLEEKFKQAECAKDNKERYVEAYGKKYDILEEKKLWQAGILCSPPFVAKIINEKIKNLFSDGKSIIFSGSPRTLTEAKEVVPLLIKLYGKDNIKIILLEISPKETYVRNTNRRICELMRHPILFSEETENLKNCPIDGSRLMRRKGLDDKKNIETRLKQFEERTLPLLEYFKEQELGVKKVNGEQSVADVFGDVMKNLKF